MGSRPKKKVERKTDIGLTAAEVETLILGHTIFDWDQEPFDTEDARRQAWRRYREQVLALQGQEHGFPMFTRPEAWWRYESPEPRRLLSGDPTNALPEKGMSLGVPRLYRSHEAWKAVTYETQRAYLERLGLMNEAEKAAMASEKHQPEEGRDTE